MACIKETVENLTHSFIGFWDDEMTTSVNIIADTMGQLFTPSLVSSTSPRRSELVVVHQSAVHQSAEISKEYIFRLN